MDILKECSNILTLKRLNRCFRDFWLWFVSYSSLVTTLLRLIEHEKCSPNIKVIIFVIPINTSSGEKTTEQSRQGKGREVFYYRPLQRSVHTAHNNKFTWSCLSLLLAIARLHYAWHLTIHRKENVLYSISGFLWV